MKQQTIDYTIVKAGPEWADKYRDFCQKAYSIYYTKPEIGITKDLFSKEVFDSSRVKDYFENYFAAKDSQSVWLALDKSKNIVGGIIVVLYPKYCEIKGFYVDPKLKGRGIGTKLFAKAEVFAGKLPIQLDVINYMDDTIAMYKKWGFKVDKEKGYILYPWEGWTEEERYAGRGIFMVRPAKT